jgi:hypothetical protein
VSGIAAWESSAVARFLRRVIEGSVVVRVGLPLVRWLRLDVQGPPVRPLEFDCVADLVEGSLVSRVVSSPLVAKLTDSRGSVFARGARSIGEAFLRLEVPRRIRLVGFMLAVALLTHVLMVESLGPAPIRAARVTWVGLLGVLVLVMAAAGPIGAAWVDRQNRRIARIEGQRA